MKKKIGGMRLNMTSGMNNTFLVNNNNKRHR